MSLHGALELLARVRPDTCVAWTSSMYFAPLVGELLSGIVDIWIADFKCGNDRCAAHILSARDYVKVAQDNICEARKTADMIVRHLVLPGHRKCCLEPVLRWIAAEAADVKVSLCGNYVPPAAACAAPACYLEAEEFQHAVGLATTMGLHLVQ